MDLDSGTAWSFHQGSGVYYGITFDGDRLYVAARDAAYGSDRLQQDNLILCFDRDLKIVETLRAPESIRDVHQITQHDGIIYIVSTFDDCIVTYDTKSRSWDCWFPFTAPPQRTVNCHHINSIHVDEHRILLAGNKPEGWYAVFDAGRTLLSPGRVQLGRGTHNVWPEPDGSIAVCSSLDGRVMSDKWRRRAVHPHAWLRGASRVGKRTILGVSQNRVRDVRGTTSCSVVQVDQEDRIERCWTFAGFGMVHDIRALGVSDPTHNGLVFDLRPDALARIANAYQTSPELVDLDATESS